MSTRRRKAPRAELRSLRQDLDLPTMDLELARALILQSPLGIKSSELAVMLGYHWSDYAAVWAIIKKLNEVYGLETFRRFTRPGSNYFIIIAEVNRPYYKLLRASSQAIRDHGITEPPSLKAARAKRKVNKKKAKILAQGEIKAQRVRVYDEFISWLGPDRDSFTRADVMSFTGTTRTSAIKKIAQWIDNDFVRQVSEPGTSEKNSPIVYEPIRR